MMPKIFSVFLLLWWLNPSFSQNLPSNRLVLNGYIRDSLSGESIIGATITVVDGSGTKAKSVASNQYGFYSITLDKGSYQLNISHVTYIGKLLPLALDSNLS